MHMRRADRTMAVTIDRGMRRHTQRMTETSHYSAAPARLGVGVDVIVGSGSDYSGEYHLDYIIALVQLSVDLCFLLLGSGLT